MGYRTLDRTWRALPGSQLRPPERLVLLALAEKTRDATGRCWPGMDWLTAATGLCPSAVRKVLAALQAGGWISRQAIGRTTAAGRPVYAAKGRRTTYRVIDRSPVDNPAKGATTGAPIASQRRYRRSAFRGQRRYGWTLKALRTERPTRTRTRQSIVTRARAHAHARGPDTTTMDEATKIVARRLGCPPAEAATIVAEVDTRHHPRNLAAYVTALDVADLTAVHAAATVGTLDAEWRAEYHARRSAAPLCPHGVPDFEHPNTGLPVCPLCRNARQSRNQHEHSH